jgi:hypothetical protein
VLPRLSPANARALTSKEFFPHLVAGPFHHGLVVVFTAAIIISLAGALISMTRGRQYIYVEPPAGGVIPAAAVAGNGGHNVIGKAERMPARLPDQSSP